MARPSRLAPLALTMAVALAAAAPAAASVSADGSRPTPVAQVAGAIVVAQSEAACDAMDDTTAAAALGAGVRRDHNPQSALPGLCSWRSNGVAGDSLTIQVDDGGQDKYDFDRGRLPVNDIADVGDKAFAFVSPAGFVQLGMMKNGIYVAIILQVQNAPDVLERTETLARAIAGRM